MAQQRTTWKTQFTFQNKEYYYNRIPFNNRAERAVEVPIAFDFLARQEYKEKILEVGNVLQYYENALSDHTRIRSRRIVDKFEEGHGIDNIDILDLDPNDKYHAIVCISTLEHVGQNSSPTGQFGEQNKITDLEAPLKAIAKVYDLLEVGGNALITVPFGKLMDGGWYIQFDADYLALLVTKYGIPLDALKTGFLKCLGKEAGRMNPYQEWVEVQAEELADVSYDFFGGGSRSIAVIELTKQPQPFSLNFAVPSTPLQYTSFPLAKGLSYTIGIVRNLLP